LIYRHRYFYNSLRAITSLITLVISVTANANVGCENTASEPGTQHRYSDAWGTTFNGERYQSSANTTINAENASNLKLQWSYGLSTQAPRSYPLVTEDTIFIGDGGYGLVALDKKTGCTRWANTDIKDIESAVVAGEIDGNTVLIFTGRRSGVYAVDAKSGKQIWFSDPKVHPVPFYSGSPMAYKDKVYVPISSFEIALSANPFYGCCTTTGGIMALDIKTGEKLWFTPTVENAGSIVTGRHFLFVEERGPSGAPVWSAPTLDTKRNLLYFGSGENYTKPATQTSDAIFAIDAETGKVVWVKQYTAGDAFNMACTISADHPNCPTDSGPDLDFGAPPVLTTLKNGMDIIVAGQKSGAVFGINPATGDTIWSTLFGRGGMLGGVHWGIAVDPELEQAYIPISDLPTGESDIAPGHGLYAISSADGSTQWSATLQENCKERSCWPGFSAAITSGPNIVVAGTIDGHLKIYRGTDGELLWSHNTVVDVESVNQIPAKGGTLDAHGPMLAGNQLIVSSGYDSFGQWGGNALLVFSVEEEQAQ